MAVYEIRVKGHLDGSWSEWFDGLVIFNLKNGEAVLSGEIVDQAALHGVLIKVRTSACHCSRLAELIRCRAHPEEEVKTRVEADPPW